MIEEILPDIYRLEIPIPKNPLKAVNSYVIRSKSRNLIIDTGMNIPVCKEAILSGLKELEIDIRNTDFFITHLHADHLGLVSEIVPEHSKVYFNEEDAALICEGGRWHESIELFKLNGFPVEDLHTALKMHPGYKYSAKGNVEYTIVNENDEIKVGDYSLKCIKTPGHTEGHMCLYEPQKKLLLSGDHVLNDITPNTAQWFYDTDPLNNYLTSLKKIAKYDVDLVLPGHRKSFTDLYGRVSELQEHHKRRLNEISSILDGDGGDAYYIASLMSWDLNYESWEQFPIIQKMFACGEALAHLTYLVNKGIAVRKLINNKYVYKLK